VKLEEDQDLKHELYLARHRLEQDARERVVQEEALRELKETLQHDRKGSIHVLLWQLLCKC